MNQILKSVLLSWCLCSLLLTTHPLQAQAPWTLEQCIRYGLENNLQLQQGRLSETLAKENLQTQRLQSLPSLNGNTSYGYFSGRNVDPTTYQFTNQTIATNQIGLSSNLNLWSGKRQKHTTEQLTYELQATKTDQLKACNDFALTVAQTYLQAILSKEQAKVASSFLNLTQKQTELTYNSYAYGAVPQSSLAESDAQLATAEANVQAAVAAEVAALANLKLLLELPDEVNFTIVAPDTDPISPYNNTLVTKNMLLEQATTTQPQLLSRKYRLKSAEKNFAIAKSYLYPSLSMFGGINTSFSNAGRRIVAVRSSNEVLGFVLDTIPITFANQVPEFGKNPYFDQVDQNLNKQIGLQLSIPMFNGGQVQSNIRKARIALEQQQLAQKTDAMQLYRDVTIAQNNTQAAWLRYQAANKKKLAIEKSFGYVEAKYASKMATTLEYITAQNSELQATNELLQAKYEYLFQLKIVDYYAGNPIR